MISKVSSMPLKPLKKEAHMSVKPCVNMAWDSNYESYVAYMRPGPLFEPQLPLISNRVGGTR